jgi:hypothetical protein
MKHGIRPILKKEDFYLSLKGYKVFTENIILKEGFVVEAIVSIVPMGSIPKWINNFGTVFELLILKSL